MGLNHRYILRVVTDGALVLFVMSAVGAVLWVTDEFLGWNILPDWIDKYAQLIIVLFGAATGLAVGASLLCSVALMAESAAQRAGIEDYRTPPRIWRLLGLVVVLFGAGLFLFYQIDVYRKGVALQKEEQTERVKSRERVQEFQAVLPRLVEAFPGPLVEAMSGGTLSEQSPELVTFLSAIQSSTAHHPEVILLTRANAPYRFCRYRLRSRRDGQAAETLGRFYIERQFYTGFPSEAEAGVVRRLFEGQAVALESRIEGEVINNLRPGAWGVLSWKGEAAGLLVIQGDFPNRFEFSHGG